MYVPFIYVPCSISDPTTARSSESAAPSLSHRTDIQHPESRRITPLANPILDFAHPGRCCPLLSAMHASLPAFSPATVEFTQFQQTDPSKRQRECSPSPQTFTDETQVEAPESLSSCSSNTRTIAAITPVHNCADRRKATETTSPARKGTTRGIPQRGS
jgi:hypothetical protein